MQGILYHYLADDHDRLDRLLREAAGAPGTIDKQPYAGFRKGLLRHIAMEEKIVLPMIAQQKNAAVAAVTGRIRLDHGALVALLVPPPTGSIVATLQSILSVHNSLEEKEGGLYEVFEGLAGPDADAVLGKLRSIPDVPVVPHNERPEVLEATRRAVARAGHEFKEAAGGADE